jgi:16S rRNA (cytidine(1402)-2'-O)-methyltransferase
MATAAPQTPARQPEVTRPIAHRLAALRGQLKRWVLVHGLARWIWLLLAIALVDMGLDRFFKMDFAQRLIVWILVLAVVAGWLVWRVLRPVTKQVSDDALLLQVEAKNRQLQQKAITGYQLARETDFAQRGVSPELAEAAIAAGHHVTALPGASAVLVGLVLSGLPSDRFFFEGFLPSRSTERRRRLGELVTVPATLVFFEAPHRTPESLADLADILGDRPAVMARELTKKFETVRRGRLPDLAGIFAAEGPPKGEVVLMVGPPQAGAGMTDETIDAALQAALATHTQRDAVHLVSAELGLPRKRVYARALRIAGEAPDDRS